MARETTKPRSRWVPWLVVLGMFIVLVVLPFGIWLAVQSRRVSQFRRAVEAIEALGGGVEIAERAPEWLRLLFGEHFFARAEWVWYPTGASDEALVGHHPTAARSAAWHSAVDPLSCVSLEILRASGSKELFHSP
jgi:hypothetical protein